VPLPVLAVVIGVVVAVTFGVLNATRSGGGAGADVALSLPRADAATDASLPSAASTTTLATTLHVHAAGAVQRPGVVEVPAGARVVDVVNAAGGAAGDADLNQINLAELVTDGERIYVPRAGEVVASIAGPASSGSGSSGSKDGGGIVNINEADATELESLPGVGPATAQAILDYRSEHGRFRSVDDLLNVRGIGPAKLEQIKPHARV
jgi:competence protein ComEA